MSSVFAKPTSDVQTQWLDAIVREVVERLLQMDGESKSGPVRSSDVPLEQVPANEILLAEKVITMESLRGHDLSQKTVVVSVSAVVTPAVKDELRDRGAKLERRESLDAVESTPAGSMACLTQGNLSRLDPQLMGLGIKVVDANGLDWDLLRSRAAEEVSRHGGAIMVALEPYVAVCELNRSPSLRAGYSATATAMGKLAQQLQPNVVVIDARRYTHATLREAMNQLKRVMSTRERAGGEIR